MFKFQSMDHFSYKYHLKKCLNALEELNGRQHPTVVHNYDTVEQY